MPCFYLRPLPTSYAAGPFYLFGGYHGTGGKLKYIAEDWSDVRLELPLSWRTRNYMGTIVGGSIYSAVDPIYMLMLIRRLAPDFHRVGQSSQDRISETRPGNLARSVCD